MSESKTLIERQEDEEAMRRSLVDALVGVIFPPTTQVPAAARRPPPATTQDQVHVARAHPRNQETGAICFDVTYSDGSRSRVPIQAFVDLSDATFSHEAVADAVNDWVTKAEQYPFVRRNCLCCNARARAGQVLCAKCTPKWGEAVYA